MIAVLTLDETPKDRLSKAFFNVKHLTSIITGFKLAFFGASKFDPKSDLWTRITMFQGAPHPGQFDNDQSEEWAFPLKPCTEAA